MKRLLVLSVACAAVAAVLAPPASALNADLDLVSRQSWFAGGAAADDHAVASAMSPNGRYVVFQSSATNLGTPGYSTYLRDTLLGTTELVSRADGPHGTAVDGSYGSDVSDNGRYVTFVALDYGNVIDPDSVLGFDPGIWPEGNVYVRDTWGNQTELVSRASGASGAGANGLSFGESISGNGRYVAFNSASSNLSPDATEIGPTDIPVIQTYVRDRWADTTSLVSRQNGGGGPAASGGVGSSNATSISDDGTRVAFSAYATNLGGDSEGSFVRDIPAQTTTRVGDWASIDAWRGPELSGDGRYVLIMDAELYRRHIATGQQTLIARATGAGPDEPAGGFTWTSSISSSGRYVAFTSDSSALPSGDGATRQVYVRDVLAGTTKLVSRRAGGALVAGDDWSSDPFVSADGRSIAFNTWAPNLVDDDLDTPNVWRPLIARLTP